MTSPLQIAPARGKLGVLLVGIGAVSTTTIAGVSPSAGLAKPIGSLTQMGTIRLGKRTDGRSPLINDFVPLAGARRHRVRRLGHLRGQLPTRRRRPPGCSRPTLLEQMRPELEAIKPMPAVFDQRSTSSGSTARTSRRARTRWISPNSCIDDIREFKQRARLRPPRDGLVRQHRDLPDRVAGAHHASRRSKALEANDPNDPVEHDLRLRGAQEGVPFANGAPNLTADMPALLRARRAERLADRRQGFQDRADADEDDHRARPQGAHARRQGLVLDQHPRQPRRRSAGRSGVVQDQGRDQEVGARPHPPAAPLPGPVQATCTTSSASTTTRRAATTKRAGTTSTSSAGSATRCRSRSTSCAATSSWRRRSCSTSALFLDLAQRAGHAGIQEWLSFYFKAR